MTNPNQTNPNQSPNPNRLTQDPKLISAHLKSAPPPTNPIRTWIAPYRALIDYYLSKTLTAPRLAEGLPWLKPILSDIANLTELPDLPNSPTRKKASAWPIIQSCKTRTHMDDLPARIREEGSSSWAQITPPKLPEPCPPPGYWDDIQPAARVNSASRRALQTQFLASIDPAAKRPEPLVIIDDPATLPRQPRAKSNPAGTQPRNPSNQAGQRDLYRDFPQLLDH